MKCKVCNGKIIERCRCLRADVTCINGHSYHWSPFHQEYHEGISDHSEDSSSQNCCTDKKKLVIKAG